MAICFHNYFRVILGTAAALGLVSAIGKAKKDSDLHKQFFKDFNEVLVLPPSSAPPLTQESIDLALLFFGIEVPPDAEHPQLDRDLVDRGITVKPTLYGKNKVSIGPEAFTSWAILGSTLAHELEVHCQQSFLGVWILDLLGLDGTHLAERVAYLHEIKNKNRFKLKIDEEAMIAETLDFYYPESWSSHSEITSKKFFDTNQMSAKSHQFKVWLSKKVVGP